MAPEILISNGTYFNFNHPERAEYTIFDIAHSLSNLCRYTGHVGRFYSVAQHSVMVSEIVPERYALAGLLHDASEAFLGDVASPLKQLLPDYQAIEERVERAVLAKFGLDYPLPDAVKRADMIALATEERVLCPRHKQWEITVDLPCLAPDTVTALPPDMARDLFLERFQDITAKGVSNVALS